MRTIKFRGKRVDNGDWVNGSFMPDYIHHKSGASIVEGGVIWHEVDPETVGQFVGLHDKDGKEIYEGDVVKVENHDSLFGGRHIKQISYVENSARFHAMGTYCENLSKYIHDTSGKNISTVIGDVHNNPELIK